MKERSVKMRGDVSRPSGGVVFEGAGINSFYPEDFHNCLAAHRFRDTRSATRAISSCAAGTLSFARQTSTRFSTTVRRTARPTGSQATRAGRLRLQTIQLTPFTIASGVPISIRQRPPALRVLVRSGLQHLLGECPNFRTPYNYNYNLQIEKGLRQVALLQVGYVGSAGHRLMTTATSTSRLPASTPPTRLSRAVDRFRTFPDSGVINEIEQRQLHYSSPKHPQVR